MKKSFDPNDISKKAGFNVDEFKKAAQSGNAEDFISQNLSPDAAAKLKKILSDKSATEKIMSSPQAKELMKKFGTDK